jgi:2'-5' RNA ligase
VRLFVALDLPEALVFPEAAEPWRPVPRDKQHVTLVFIGSVDEPPGFAEPPPAAPLVVEEAITLPPRRPRVLAVRLSDPTGAHTAYQGRLARALERVEDRPWLPHVTIGRARSGVPRGTELPVVEPVSFVPVRATLYRSAGGRYEPVDTLPATS